MQNSDLLVSETFLRVSFGCHIVVAGMRGPHSLPPVTAAGVTTAYTGKNPPTCPKSYHAIISRCYEVPKIIRILAFTFGKEAGISVAEH